MNSIRSKEQHDLSAAFLSIYNFVDLVESDYDFKTKKGLSVIEATRNAIKQLEDRTKVLKPE